MPVIIRNVKIIPNLFDELCDIHIKGNVLDYGCATGSFLRWIKEKTSCSVYGVEIIDAFVAFARQEYSIDVTGDMKFFDDVTRLNFISLCYLIFFQ